MPGLSFCEGERRSIEQETYKVLDDAGMPFADKVKKLNQISVNPVTFSAEYEQHYARRAASSGLVVAALVACESVPYQDAVFIGRLRGDDPLTLSRNGVELKAEMGTLFRVYTHNEGHNYRYGIAGRYDNEQVPVGQQTLHVQKNQLVPARFKPSPMTIVADRTLAEIDGLDFKICFEGTNLPPVNEAGYIDKSKHGGYDRLGLVALLGEDLYRETMQAVRLPAEAASVAD